MNDENEQIFLFATQDIRDLIAQLDEKIWYAQSLTVNGGIKYGTIELLAELDMMVSDIRDVAQKVYQFQFVDGAR